VVCVKTNGKVIRQSITQVTYYAHRFIILAQHAGDVEISPLKRVALSM